MPRCLWKVFYDDGSTYSSLDGPPEDAPAWGVQVVTLFDEKIGRTVQHSRDYYLFRHDAWWGSDHIGMIDYLQTPGWKRVLFGRTVKSDNYRTILEQASFHDHDLPYQKP